MSLQELRRTLRALDSALAIVEDLEVDLKVLYRARPWLGRGVSPGEMLAKLRRFKLNYHRESLDGLRDLSDM